MSLFSSYIGKDISLLTEHDALLLQQIARDLLHALSHRHNNTWTTFGESVVSTGGDINSMLVEFHLSETNGSSQSRTWTARVTDGDPKHYAISPSPLVIGQLQDDCRAITRIHDIIARQITAL